MKDFTITAFGDPIQVRQMSLGGPLGSWNPKSGIIFIEQNQPEIGKHITLMHELLHLVDDICIQSGATKRRTQHNFITNAPAILLTVMICADLYDGGFSAEELADFMLAKGKR